jgi:CRISPR-associated protein Csx3
MSSYLIDVDDDTLRVKLNLNEPASGDRLVRDAADRLQELIDSGCLPGGQLLKIDGPTSVPLAYTLAHRLSHLYGAIAVCDPKLARPGKKVYIVCASHNPHYQIGELIVTDESYSQSQPATVKLAFCGAAVDAKSLLLQELEAQIKSFEGAPYPKIYSASPVLAAKLAKDVKNSREAINLINVAGGEREAQILMKSATHAVIVVEENEEEVAIASLCQTLNLPIVAIVRSNAKARVDRIETQDDRFIQGVMYCRQPDEMVSSSPVVEALASLIVNLVGKA